jgi:hypothetical protein
MNIRDFLPIEDYALTSMLSIDEIKKRISENIEREQRFTFVFFRNNTRPYEGTISGDTFKISRIIQYRNSFLPIITGHISSYFGQTLIKIKMRMLLPVVVVMALLLVISGLLSLFLLFGEKSKTQEFTRNVLPFDTYFPIPYIMFLAGWLVMLIAFKVESNKSKKFLSSLLEGQETMGY